MSFSRQSVSKQVLTHSLVSIINASYTSIAQPVGGFKTFADFYPFYLGEHSNVTCRRLHLIGTTLTAITAWRMFRDIQQKGASEANIPKWLGTLALVGYSFAWVGHFFFEKNKPATFTYPIFSLMGDFKMWWEVLTLQRPF